MDYRFWGNTEGYKEIDTLTGNSATIVQPQIPSWVQGWYSSVQFLDLEATMKPSRRR